MSETQRAFEHRCSLQEQLRSAVSNEDILKLGRDEGKQPGYF